MASTPNRPIKKLKVATWDYIRKALTLLSFKNNLPSWMFRIHIEVSDDFSIFSKYTPLNPLERQANKMADKPIIEDLKSYGLAEGDSVLLEGHYKIYNCTGERYCSIKPCSYTGHTYRAMFRQVK